MAKHILLLFVFMIYAHQSMAILTAETATYSYSLNPAACELVVKNKSSDNKSILTLDHVPASITLFNDKAYVVGQRSVSIVSLDTFKILKVLSVERTARELIIHNHFGYISNEASSTVSVLDFTSDEIIATLAVGSFPHPMVIYKDIGFIVNRLSDSLSVIDLNSNLVLPPIPAQRSNNPMSIQGAYGSIPDNESGAPQLVDLERRIIIQSIPTEKCCNLL